LLIRLSSRHSASEEGITHVAYGVRTALGTVLGAVPGSCVTRRTLRRTDLGFSCLNFDTHRIFERGDNTEKHYNTEPCAFPCVFFAVFVFVAFVQRCLRVALRPYGAVRCPYGVGTFLVRSFTVPCGAVRLCTVSYGGWSVRWPVCRAVFVRSRVRTRRTAWQDSLLT
jgi:hypothetical protein